MAVGGGGVEALFWHGPITPGDVASWESPGVLKDGGAGGGGSGMAIGGTVTSGTPGSVLFVGAGPVLAQDNANFFWNDASEILQIGSTSKASLVGLVTGAYDGTTHGSVRIGGSPGATSFFDLMSNPNGANSIPVPTFRPVVANKTIALDLCPNGSPTDFGYGKAWIDLCNTDQITSGNAATQTIHMAAHAASFFLGAAEYISSTILPFNFGTFDGDAVVETTTFTINADASLTIAQPTKFSSMTSGSIPYFGTGGLLSQDNAKFAWDDTNGILKVDGSNAMYKVAASPDNWFIGGAGNTSVTGTGNFGEGPTTLQSVSTGSGNMAMGALSLRALGIGSLNTAVGGQALINLTDGDSNVGIGANAGSAITGATYYNICIGTQALGGLSTPGSNANIGIGVSAWGLASGTENVGIGHNIASGWASGNFNTVIGSKAAQNVTGGDNNTLIGRWLGPSSTMSNVIALSDGAQNLRIDYGFTNAATWTSPAAICVTPVAVGSLPTAGIAGRRHFVTDATATTFASIVAGGGANKVPVYEDGTNWRIG